MTKLLHFTEKRLYFLLCKVVYRVLCGVKALTDKPPRTPDRIDKSLSFKLLKGLLNGIGVDPCRYRNLAHRLEFFVGFGFAFGNHNAELLANLRTYRSAFVKLPLQKHLSFQVYYCTIEIIQFILSFVKYILENIKKIPKVGAKPRLGDLLFT